MFGFVGFVSFVLAAEGLTQPSSLTWACKIVLVFYGADLAV